MAYLPPHKRHSKDSTTPAPTPSSLQYFKQALTLSRSHKSRQRPPKILYAANSISKWFTSPDPIPPSFRLQPSTRETSNQNPSLVLVADGDRNGGAEEEKPWVSVAERVVPDLVAAFRTAVKADLPSEEESKLSFVARAGKVLFHGIAVDLESVRKAANAESDSRNQVHKSFYTNVPNAYMENIEHLVVPKIALEFDSEKEHYHVKVSDKCRPDSTISCKCTVVKDGGELKIHKIELNQMRQLLVDISCLYKDLDLRLMMVTKRMMTIMSDEEHDALNTLVRSAVIDPDVKGGLRWPLGKESVADRFNIVGVWHTKNKSFKSERIRLKLRHADRFDHRTSTGEVSTEVTLRPTGITKHLRDGVVEEGLLKEMVEEVVELIWNRFLSYSYP